MWWLAVYILWAPHSPPPHSPPHPSGQGWGVRGERRGCGLPLLEERSWCWRSPRPAPQFSLRGEEPPPPPSPPPLLHIWLPPERSFGGKTRMFLFPRREEELQSETTELKHREASWALTQSAARLWWWGVSLLPYTLLVPVSLLLIFSPFICIHASVLLLIFIIRPTDRHQGPTPSPNTCIHNLINKHVLYILNIMPPRFLFLST